MTVRITAINSFLICFFTVLFSGATAQIYDPVSWTFSVEERGENFAVLSLKAEIEEGWHVYATELPNDDGPIATSFTFESAKHYKLDGKIIEPEFITKHDPNFDMDLNFHDGSAHFKQRIKLKTDEAFTVNGYLTFMTCDDEKCLPPEDVEFMFSIPASKGTDKAKETDEGNSGLQIGGSNPPIENGILEPVKWSFEIEETAPNQYVFIATADIDDTWHMYSQHLESLDGPLPTEFIFEQVEGLKMVGSVSEPTPITKYDSVFEMELSYFDHKAEFRQKFENTGSMVALVGSVGFMACDDEKCVFPDPEEFRLVLPGKKEVVSVETTDEGDSERKGMLSIFLIAFFSGLAALLTPCVFPMIPLTVSFFTKGSENRRKGVIRGVWYGVSIFLIYVLLSAPFHILDSLSTSILNEISTSIPLNIFFFVMLFVFGISFLGAFEITLPSSLVNKVDSASDIGGFAGIFLMALTLTIVSFSCTGPVLGGLLAGASQAGGDPWHLTAGMAGFGVALGLPFALFAIFPGLLNSLPQSGGWLNTVKVFLGFLEIAFAFKFLSNADLVVQAGYLTREVFIAIWIGIFGTLALYLFGAFRLPHDSPIEKLSITRVLMGVVTIVFTIYLIPGMWGAPLKIISGFPPPLNYSESPTGFGGSGIAANEEILPEKAHATVHGLTAFKDYEAGLAYAKMVNKPVFIDFTGHACVNCRKMEENVWSEPEVLSRLKNEVVLISLYVDDKRDLPESQQVEVTIGSKTKTLKSIGNKWSYFQASRYKSNSQPLYVLMDHNEENLVEPMAYDLDVDNYVEWLDAGIKAFKEQSSN